MTSPNGCTNPNCTFKHDPPKTATPKASRSPWSYLNAFSSVGNILRGNRQ
jgi:hypothetical protein